MLSFLRKTLLVVGVAGILGITAYFQTEAPKPAPNLAEQKKAEEGKVLGASTTPGVRVDSEIGKICPFKIFTDSLPRGEEKIGDAVCNH